MKHVTLDRDLSDLQKTKTLGSLRLQHATTHETILIPTPSDDPNDPLNWAAGYRWYLAILTCLAMFFCNFLAAGPTVAVVAITIDFFGTPPYPPNSPPVGPPSPAFLSSIAKVAYFFTTTALMQGLGNLIWMPLIVKYGRRPVYLASFTLYTGTAIWAGVSTSYSSELASRILMGVFAGAGECVAPLTIADIFFLHERGTVMAMYNAALASGVAGGIIIAGLITIDYSWRYIYYIATALIGALTILVFFTMPETSFNRSPKARAVPTHLAKPSELYSKEGENGAQISQIEAGSHNIPARHSYVRSLRIFNGTLTREPIYKLMFRPVAFLILPPVLWAVLVMSVTIGFLVAISSNFASAFSTTYGFKSWQSGLCFISGFIGSFLGIFGGGWISDKIANYLTGRNGGIREPEMRLPAVMVGVVMSPLALILYGVGIANKLHWMVPTLGLGFLSFAIASATNVSLVYTIDSYRPVAGEVVVTQLAFKSAFGFLLSFYTNPWIAKDGYAGAFGAMAGISGVVLLGWVPLYFWGKRIRQATFNWNVMKTIRWDEDREVGE